MVEVRAVQLPGRAQRFYERSRTAFLPLCEELVEVIQRCSDLPFALFGHSLGALLAFEVTRALAAKQNAPLHLFVSGCGAPKHRQPGRPLHLLDDHKLCLELAQYHGTPAEVLADRELMQLLLPVIRDDFALVHDYHYQAARPMNVPMTVFAGREDNAVPLEWVSPWADETGARCDIHWFNGGHFFIDTERHAVTDCVRRQLAPYMDRKKLRDARYAMDGASIGHHA